YSNRRNSTATLKYSTTKFQTKKLATCRDFLLAEFFSLSTGSIVVQRVQGIVKQIHNELQVRALSLAGVTTS
ncbi:hypothetical protein T05_834, partial [Trichinella murrelli]